MSGSITSFDLPVDGALVFQCASCRAILSDSHEFVCTLSAPDGAKCVCLRGLTEARLDRIPHNSSAGSGRGSSGGERSTHYTVCCAGCGAAVGRLYSEMPATLLPVRNLFCLEVQRCLSYQLGSAEMRAPGSAAAASAAAAAAQQQQQSGGGDGAAAVDPGLLLELLERVEQLDARLCSLSGIQVLHDRQLQTLPGYVAGGDSPLVAGGGGGGV